MERATPPNTYVNTYVCVTKNISGSAPKSWIIWINVPQMASRRQKRWSKILDQDPHSVIQLDPRCEDSLRHRNVGSFGSFVITYWLNVGKNEWSKWSNIAMTQSNVSTLAWQGVVCQDKNRLMEPVTPATLSQRDTSLLSWPRISG